MLAFDTIPIDIRTPGQFIEFNSTLAQRASGGRPRKVLLVGQKRANGTAISGQLVETQTISRAVDQFGQGSMLARMHAAYRLNDATADVWSLPLTDLAGGVTATGTLTFGGAVTQAGTVSLLIAGKSVNVPVAAGASLASIAAAVTAAVTKARDLPVTAAAVAAVVTLTARHKGTLGNGIDVRNSYFRGERLPAGLTLAVVAMAGGTGDPDATTLFAELGDEPFTDIIWPYTDATNLNALEAALTARWGPLRMLDGFAYMAIRGGYSGVSATAAARNHPYSSMLAIQASPTPTEEVAAAYGAQVGFSAQNDPARPFQTLQLLGVLAPVPNVRFTRDERQLLYYDGASATVVNADGGVRIDRAITTYKTSPEGVDDIAYLDVNTPLTLSYLRWSLRERIARKFGRHKLADDGAVSGRGRATVTPNRIIGELVDWYSDMRGRGLVENVEQFSRRLIVERDPADPNRINALLPPDLVNQFRVFGAQIQFIL